MAFVRPSAVIALIGLAVAAFFVPQAGAQQVFRVVGPDGRVTFSDKAPADGSGKVAPTVALADGNPGASLPFELRQVASRYPVTLYTSNNCGACASGRAYLTSRGIPFTEKTVTSNEDAETLKRIAGESLVPLLTIGGQQIRGYSDAEWTQFLNAAGYPARSVLPGSWRNPPPSPLVAMQRPVAPNGTDGTSTAAGRRAASPPQNPPPSAPAEIGDNPAGIKF